MVNKKILGVAVAAAMYSTGSLAAVSNAIDLDANNAKGVKVATESLLTTGKVTVSSVDHYVVTSLDGAAAGFSLDATAKLGLGLAADTPIYVRYDLTNAVFKTAVTAANLAVTDSGAGATETLTQGGGTGQNFVIFGATPEATKKFEIADTATLDIADIAITGAGNATLKASFYLSVTDAINKKNAFKSVTLSDYVAPTSGLAVTSVDNDVTADVEKDFKNFLSGVGGAVSTTAGELGAFSVAAVTGVGSAAGAQVTLADMVTVGTSKVVISGNFSSGTWGIDTGAGNCAGALTAGVINTAKTTFTTNVGALNAEETLCNVQDGKKVIPKSTYSATATFTAVTNAAMPATAVTKAIGEMLHNGTTVQLPYLTTFADYNQRLIVVNRGSNDVAYNISFTSEGGVTAAAGSAATGTLKAGATTVLKVSDIVTLTGGTRTAGTLTIVSPQANIDVATTQVNRSNGGTDTVKLK